MATLQEDLQLLDRLLDRLLLSPHTQALPLDMVSALLSLPTPVVLALEAMHSPRTGVRLLAHLQPETSSRKFRRIEQLWREQSMRRIYAGSIPLARLPLRQSRRLAPPRLPPFAETGMCLLRWGVT